MFILLGLFLQIKEVENWQDSISTYLEIIQNYPDSTIAAEAYLKMIDIYTAAGDIDSVEIITDRIKKKDKGIYREAYRHGLSVLYQDMGQRDKAGEFIRKLARDYCGVSNYRSTQVYRPEEISVEKIKEWIDEKKRKHLTPQPLFLMSFLLALDSSYTKAEYILLELKSWPDSQAVKGMMPDVSYQLANVYYQSEKYYYAIDELKTWLGKYDTLDEPEVVQLKPKTRYLLAKTYEKIQYYGDALLIYQCIIDSFPKLPESQKAIIKIMEFYLKAGQYDILERQLQSSQYQFDSSYFSDISLIRAKVYIGQNRYEKARAELESWISKYNSVEITRNDLKPEVLYLLGIILEKHYKSYSEAFDKYSEVFENYPNSEWAGKAAKKIIAFRILAKQVDKAVEVTEEVKKRLYKNSEVYKNAYAYGVLSLFEYYTSLDQKKTPPCEQFFKSLSIENFYNIGKSDFEKGDYEDARDILSKIKLLKECEEARSIMPEALVILAKSYYNLVNYNQAINELEEWLEYGEDVKQEHIPLLPEIYYYLALSYSNIPEGSCKALDNFRIIKSDYQDTEFYKSGSISADIEQKIAESEKACNGNVK